MPELVSKYKEIFSGRAYETGHTHWKLWELLAVTLLFPVRAPGRVLCTCRVRPGEQEKVNGRKEPTWPALGVSQMVPEARTWEEIR